MKTFRLVRLATFFLPLFGTRTVRVSVTWRRGHIRRFKVEYVRPNMIRRWIDSLRR